jgi:hypothetical protein
VTVNYYLAQSKVAFKVTRTVGCDAKNNIIVANAAAPEVTHAADKSAPESLGLSPLNGTLSDTDVKFEFYDDGRLKSVNATGTGQGETILKTVITIAAAVAAFDGGTTQFPEECTFIKEAGAGKPLTLTYEGEVKVTKPTADTKEKSGAISWIEIPPDAASGVYAAKLTKAIGRVYAGIEGSESSSAPVSVGKEKGAVQVAARQPGVVKFKVTAGCNDGSCPSAALWNDSLPVGQLGTRYVLPIPVAPAFGKQVLAAAFAESGALTSVQYTSNTGTGQALNVANAGLTAVQGETTAQKAADVKAEADLILQQQRLVQCVADPKNCK